MPEPQIHELIESACPTSERQSCSKIYYGCSIAEMACFLSQLLPLGTMILLSTLLFFLVLLSEVTTGKKGLTQFSFGAAQKIHILGLVEGARNLNPELALISGAVVFTNSRTRCRSKRAF